MAPHGRVGERLLNDGRRVVAGVLFRVPGTLQRWNAAPPVLPALHEDGPVATAGRVGLLPGPVMRRSSVS
jgi:hypothetical protein